MSILHLAEPTRKACLAAPLAVLMGIATGESSSVPASSITPIVVPLPVLPPPHVRHPGLFDESGCALLAIAAGRKERVCPVPPQPAAGSNQTAEHGGAWSRLLGFEGPHYATTVPGAGVEILPSTLRIGRGREGEWSAVGVARNGTHWILDDIEIFARLLSADGSALETVSFPVPVRSVRPGEPVPFALNGTTAHVLVRSVRLTATWGHVDQADAEARMVEFEPTRLLSSSTVLALGADAGAVLGGPPVEPDVPRHVAWGTLKSWSPRPIRTPWVVAMWIDAEGRAVSLVRSRVWTPASGQANPAMILGPGEMGQFVAVAPYGGSSSTRQRGLRLALWETPS